MYNLIPSDAVIINTVESYMEECHVTMPSSPQQKLYYQEISRDKFYSDIARRMPRVAAHLLTDGEDSDLAKGLNKALPNHCMDSRYIDILMQFLKKHGSTADCHIVGAYLVSVADRYFVKHPVKDDKKNPDAVVKAKSDIAKTIAHITNAAALLLHDLKEAVEAFCPGFEQSNSIAIAAALAFENETTLKELIHSDLPVTADVLKVYSKPDRIIISALKLKKKDFAKLTKNQETFVESLKKFVFTKLNSIEAYTCFDFLCRIYNSTSPDFNEYLICGTDALKSEYPSLVDAYKEFKTK